MTRRTYLHFPTCADVGWPLQWLISMKSNYMWAGREGGITGWKITHSQGKESREGDINFNSQILKLPRSWQILFSNIPRIIRVLKNLIPPPPQSQLYSFSFWPSPPTSLGQQVFLMNITAWQQRTNRMPFLPAQLHPAHCPGWDWSSWFPASIKDFQNREIESSQIY